MPSGYIFIRQSRNSVVKFDYSLFRVHYQDGQPFSGKVILNTSGHMISAVSQKKPDLKLVINESE